ncbi:DUF6233 domain-containing protein, partial [Streptomyces sp. NPDC056821]|uniref:DUF6233 domain-containing protein n=1 Tax=unclassified Streptomyces TaxID=2593676 RepID=UPI0036BC5EE1
MRGRVRDCPPRRSAVPAAAYPVPPGWILEGGLNGDSPPVAVHVGGCHMAGTRWKGVPRDVALRALSEGIEACG